MRKILIMTALLALLGAGCASAPKQESPKVAPAPVTASPTSSEITITPALKKQFEQDFKKAAAARQSFKLPPGHYFISDIDSKKYLVQRIKFGTYKIIGATGNDDFLDTPIILEPKSQNVLYIETGIEKDGIDANIYDLKTKQWLNKNIQDGPADAQIEIPSAVSPNEDQLLYIGDDQIRSCVSSSVIDWSCIDFGKQLVVRNLSKTTRSTVMDSGKKFGHLPDGFSYAETVYQPNLMGEGIKSAGRISWTSSGIKAVVYSDKDLIGLNVPARKPLRTVTVRLDQAIVDLK